MNESTHLSITLSHVYMNESSVVYGFSAHLVLSVQLHRFQMYLKHHVLDVNLLCLKQSLTKMLKRNEP
jgi:hypothetical protein